MNNQRGISALVLILIIFILLVLVGGGFIVFKQKQSANYPKVVTFDHVDLNEEVVVFLYQQIPGLYNRISQLNNELTLISGELERIESLENEYPSGKQFINDERSLWMRLQKELNTSLQSVHDASESYYVAYMVNPLKGKTLISENSEDLLERIDNVLAATLAETGRLKTVSNQTVTEKLKNLFRKK